MWRQNRGISCSSTFLVKAEWVSMAYRLQTSALQSTSILEFGHYKTRFVAEEATVIDYYM